MSKVQTLRAFVNQRLTLAAKEIFERFESTIAEYEGELCRQNKLLNAVFMPEVRLHRTDVQQLLVGREEVPPEQPERSPLLDQEEPPELPHIKEEQEVLWSSLMGEQFQGLEEADIYQFTFTPVPVKSDEDIEKPLCSQLHQRQKEQMTTEADGEDYGGPESAQNFYADSHLQPATHEEKSHSSEPETDDSCHWEETREPQTGSNPLQNNEEPVREMKCNTVKTSVISTECATNKKGRQKHNVNQADVEHFSCIVCGRRYQKKGFLKTHMKRHSKNRLYTCMICEKIFTRKDGLVQHIKTHTGERPFRCSICDRGFAQNASLISHFRVHSGEKPFSCSVCKASFRSKASLPLHMRTHTGEKPFGCSVCGKKFTRKVYLRQHMAIHTGEKPFPCSVCGMRFVRKEHLNYHNRIHTGERPFSCSVCDKTFIKRIQLTTHSRVHTGEKPFSCPACNKSFTTRENLSRHMRVHTGEKPFMCSVCGRGFSEKHSLIQHLGVHTGEAAFDCSVCKQTFPSNREVVRHMNTHLEMKPEALPGED